MRRSPSSPRSWLALISLVATPGPAATPPEFAPAVAAAERGDAAECARLFDRIAAAATPRGLARRARYGEAVCAATAGELDRAFAALEAAIALDFHDATRLYDDPRLRPLRADGHWPALEAKFHAAVARWRAGLHAELLAVYEEDQRDRSPGPGGIDWQQVAPRDRERLRRVREILAADVPLTPDDRYHAAIVLQHGETREDYELAHELARRAAEEDADHPHARWLAAAALDRALVADGRPQRYGTQSVREGDRWVLAPVDPAVTDAERDAWDVPPLAESLARVEAMNGGAPPAPGAAPPVD
ncbi:MAG: hypothetical protein NDJ75_07965 [Thermoanaerobaculia bacterium]|nr:hypothetical protein [Thermoanaerobaculia bacterium]